ncbi:MAG: cyclic nucleotide-binding domain-containing protein, partial [Spirochaetes bacterium]|nr:cyclic nucleotide-binding domain-containing protein [Spirochaetota bacterium]
GKPIDKEEIARYYPPDFDSRAIPDLKTEFQAFAADLQLDVMVTFIPFGLLDGTATVEASHPDTGIPGRITVQTDGFNRFTIRDPSSHVTYKDIYAPIQAPKIPFSSVTHPSYVQLRNAISFIATSSGFDPVAREETSGHAHGTTVSFIIWNDLGTGTVVDPPMGFSNWMRKMGIHFFQIQDLILTHTHFDHDAGTIERILEEPVNVHTTETIMQAFLEKSSAITGISEEQLMNSINFFPVRLHTPVRIGGFTFYFSHCIHPIETIRFTFQDHEGSTYYYSSDILYSGEKLQRWVERGLITPERKDDIMTIPHEAGIYIHEMGGPGIHTPPEAIAAMPEQVRNNTWIVHTDAPPRLADGGRIPGVRMARPGMIIPLRTPSRPETDEFAATYHVLSKLDRIPLFHNMPVTSLKDIQDIMGLMKPKRYEPGSQLIRYGERPEKLYILIDGGADIVIRSDGGDVSGERMIHRNDFGFIIGDAVASKGEERRDADVYAGLQGITVLEIDEESIRRLEDRKIVLGELIRKNREMRKYGVYLALEKIPVVRDLTYAQKQAFALLCTEHPLKSDDDRWLIRQGEWNEYVYIIAEGQAEIIAQERDGRRIARKRVATSESNIFGEVSILTQSRTIASVRITGDLDKTRVYRMHKKDFNEFLRNNPNFNLNFRKKMEERIAETSQVRQNLMEALRDISRQYLQRWTGPDRRGGIATSGSGS